MGIRRALLTVRVLTLCANQLRDSNIIALGSSMPVYIPSRRAFLCSGVVIVRRWPEFSSESQDTITNPHAVIEVVSVVTSGGEHRSKLAALAQLPSLAHYVLIMDDSVTVVHHRRDDGDVWSMSRHGRHDRLLMESVDVELPIDTIYSWR